MPDLETVQLRQGISLEEWRKLILDQKASGKTIREWCKEQGCLENRFYYWQHKLRQRERSVFAGKEVRFAELPSPGHHDVACSKESGVCAVLRGTSFQLEIQNGADPETLATTLKILGGQSC